MRLSRHSVLAAVVGTSVIAGAGVARADTVRFDLNHRFSGTQSPAGAGTWLRATFVDRGPGTVRLTLEQFLKGDEHLASSGPDSGWLFNVASNKVSGLKFDFISGQAATKVSLVPDMATNGGGGRFDMRFVWGMGNLYDASSPVTVYDISRSGLTAEMFNVLSLPKGDGGAYKSAAQVFSGSGSGWIGSTQTQFVVVPLPPGVAMGVVGLLGVIGVSRLRRRGLV